MYNYTEIKSTCATAFKDGAALKVGAYINSDGEVADITVSFLPDGGYKALLKASVEEVRNGLVTKPDTISMEVWHEALNEKMTSWETSLSGIPRTKGYTEKLVRHPDGYWVNPMLEYEHVILKAMYRHERSVLYAGSATGAVSPKAVAKVALEQMLPVGRYAVQLNLYPGKFKEVVVAKEVPAFFPPSSNGSSTR